MGALLVVIGLIHWGWLVLGDHIFTLGPGQSLPLWYCLIGLAIAIGLPTIIAMRLNSGHGTSYSPDGYPGWWNRD